MRPKDPQLERNCTDLHVARAVEVYTLTIYCWDHRTQRGTGAVCRGILASQHGLLHRPPSGYVCVLQASQELQDNAIGLYDVKLTKYQLSSLQVGRGACGFAAEQFGGGIDGLQCIGGREAVI